MRIISNLKCFEEHQKVNAKETKAKLKLLLICSWRGLITKNVFSITNQRSIAGKLDCHYNAVNYSLENLVNKEFVQIMEKNEEKRFSLNLNSPEVTNLLTIMSLQLIEKIERKFLRTIMLPEEKKLTKSVLAKIPDSDYNVLEKHARYLLKNRKQIANQLASRIIDEFTQAENNKLTTLNAQEFDVLIAQQLEELPQQYTELTETWLDVNLGIQRKIVNAKLTKI